MRSVFPIREDGADAPLLRQKGFDVVYLDARLLPHHKVGESLDWSSPGLLQRLGILADGLLAGGIAVLRASRGGRSHHRSSENNAHRSYRRRRST